MCFSLVPPEITLIGKPLIGDSLVVLILGYLYFDFKGHRKTQRSESALKLLVTIKDCTDYISEIKNRSALYLYQEYYPDKIPEIALGDKTKYSERPPRLIANHLQKFKKDFNENACVIGGKEGKKLLELLRKYISDASLLANSIYAQFPECNKDIASATQPLIVKCAASLEQFTQEAELILNPIIEGKGCIYLLWNKVKLFAKKHFW